MVYIFFGSHYGTAEAFSHELAIEMQKRSLDGEPVDLSFFDEDMFLSQKVLIFILATHGDGEPTTNAKGFFRWLQAQTDTQLLKDLQSKKRIVPKNEFILRDFSASSCILSLFFS